MSAGTEVEQRSWLWPPTMKTLGELSTFLMKRSVSAGSGCSPVIKQIRCLVLSCSASSAFLCIHVYASECVCVCATDTDSDSDMDKW